MEKNGKQSFSVLRTIAAVLANLTAILSANYIVFYILDHFNPGFRFVVHSDFILTKYLHFVIPVLLLLTALLYLLIYVGGGLKPSRLRKKRVIAILIADILIAGAFAMTVNARAFGWVEWLRPTEEEPVAIATLPPEPTAAPSGYSAEGTLEDIVPEITPEATIAATPEANLPETEPAETPENVPTETPTVDPTEAPTPESTPIPGLLGDLYKEKFSDGKPVVSEPNTSETLADGTVRTLIYTYAGKDVAFDLYYYEKDKQKYQIADLYVRNIKNLTAAYVNNQSNRKGIREFAEGCGALIAVSSDYFSANANGEGLIIRNGVKIRDNPCRYSDLCVIYQNGTMRCFDCEKDKINNSEIIADYPYHSFYFGPSLLDENGKAKTNFNSGLVGKNPRTVIGYYRPGHYAFISVLGDYDMINYRGKNAGKAKASGMTLADLSKLCASMGMQAAYNLDGGRSIGMYWNKTLFGHNMRSIGDILAIVD